MYYGSRTQFWILSIAGTPESGFLKFYDLKIYNPTDRIQIIETLISEIRPDIVVIDGIRDLVFDINSPEEATNSTGDLMRWAESNNCHIINILHQNKGNEHARGHLGSEMINKSESVLKVTQNEDKQIVLEPEFTRGLAFNAIAFERDGNGIPHLIENWKPENVTANGVKRVTPPYDVDPSTHKDIIRDTFNVNPEMIRNELEVSAKANISRWLSREIGIGKVREWIQHWEQFGHIKKTGTPGTRSAKYSINKTELN